MIDNILYPLKWVVAWIMVNFHTLLTSLGMESDSGAAWALSIVGLVVVMRILLIPLFVKQIKASRGMQLLAPEMQAIQKKYKGKTDPASREAMSRETMELYRKHGTNPFASCLPILAQSPVFFALFRVLYTMPALANGTYQGGERDSIGPLDQSLAREFVDSTLWGARLSDWFLASDNLSVKLVAAVLIVLMSLTTFITQKQLTQKNMPASALQGPMAQQQKMLLYVLPLVFAISGVNFPIGVLIYWTTTNLWSMGQQFYVIRRNPTPGSEAERLLKERRAKKLAARGIVPEEQPVAVEEKPRGQRQQPKRKDRARPVIAEDRSGQAGPAIPSGATPLDGGAATAATVPDTASGAGEVVGSPTARSGQGTPARPTAGGSGKPAGTSPPAAKGSRAAGAGDSRGNQPRKPRSRKK